MDIIKKKVNASIKVINLFQEYYDYFSRGFLKVKPDMVTKLKNMIEKDFSNIKDDLLKRTLSLNTDAFLKLEIKDQQKLIFQTYTLVVRIDNILEDIYNIIDSYSFTNSEYLDSDINTGQKHESIIKENEIKSHYIKFIKAYKKPISIDLVEFFIDLIWNTIKNLNPTDSKNSISYINSLFRKYPQSIILYSSILQNLLDKFIVEKDKKYRYVSHYILDILELDKAFVLQDKFEKSAKKEKSIKGPKNPFIRSMGLAPIDEFELIDILFKDIVKIDSKKQYSDIFNNIVKKTGKSIILLQKITPNPISHIIWNLTEFNKSKNLGIDSSTDCGITENLIIRMNTIKILKSKNKWNFSGYKIYGSTDNESFYILETLNNISYRFLCPWTKCADIHTPRHKVISLLKYLGIESSDRMSDRISQYQNLHMNSLNKVYLKTYTNIDDIVNKSHIKTPIQTIKHQILVNIIKLIRKHIKKIDDPINQIELIIYKKEIFDIFIDKIIELYNLYEDPLQNDNRLKIKKSEILSTYFVNINKIKQLFRKEIHKVFIEKKRTNLEEIKNLRSTESVIVYIENLIKTSIDNIMTHKSNLYQEMYLKSSMMRIGLI